MSAPPKKKDDSMKSFIAGLSAGMASTVAGYPPDTVKVRLQTQPLGHLPRYSSGLDCFFRMIKEEGTRSLFRGMSAPLFSRAVINAVAFSTYTGLLDVFNQMEAKNGIVKPHPSFSSLFLAGGSAGVVSALIAGPSELIKVQLQVAGPLIPQNEGPILQTKRVLRSLGVRGMFVGLVPTMARDFICLGTFFATSNTLNQLARKDSNTPVSSTVSIVSGALGGVAGWLVCYPLDVWKSNVQNFSPEKGNNATYRGTPMIQFFKHRYQTQGFRSLYRGLVATLFRAAPVNGAKFFTYQLVLRLLHKLY
eukprot:TRINITY_DN15358_c0_g1_i2.p1 TRINITY_DN15358_c0_g1~~TRINITY_DN15358_c0_g1_i2.p1  ORF type:complete len:306 (-),score=43.38 TRINITY_DN15358_c0_g1_i2:231-1148(-)